MSITLYDILGVSKTASAEEIKSSYKKLAKKYHPDKNPGSSWHEEQFKNINQAYQILSDPSQKRLYDYRLEYELFNRYKQTTPQPPPTPKPKPPEAQKQAPKQQKTPPQYKRPASNSSSKKAYDTFFEPLNKLTDGKINLLVVSYYVIAITLLSLYFSYRNDLKIQAILDEAVEYEKNGNYSRAIGAYNSILIIDNEYAEAYEKRALAKTKLSWDLGNIVEDYDHAIQYSSPPSESLVFMRAKCLMQLGKYDLAMVDLDYLLTLEDKIDSVYFNKAQILFLTEKFDQAILNYTDFLKRRPSSGEAHVNRGFCFYQKKSYNAAQFDYNFAIRWQPENPENYYYRAFVKFALKDSTSGCRDLHDAFLLGYSDAAEAQTLYCKNHPVVFE